jgi:tetratricopeptide (TPR) repeat protein
MKRFILACLLYCLFLLVGCAPTQYDLGWEHIYGKNYNEAITIFEGQLAQDKNDYSTNCGLGVAHYFLGNIDNSIHYLEEANSLKPTNTEIKYYLGLCYEEKKDYRNAIKYYQYFNDKTLDGNYSKLMSKRLNNTIKLQYQTEVKDLIQHEKSIGGNLSDSTLAILIFENRTNNPDYAPLEIGFPSMFITDFALVPRLKVVERLRIQSILDELELGKKDIIDERTMQRVGRLLRAKTIIKGGFIIQSNDNIIIDLAVINVTTGKVDHSFNKFGNLDNFYRIEKDLVIEIVNKMGIVLTEDVRKKIGQNAKMESKNYRKELIMNKWIDLFYQK